MITMTVGGNKTDRPRQFASTVGKRDGIVFTVKDVQVSV
jgi:hypothetical protein